MPFTIFLSFLQMGVKILKQARGSETGFDVNLANHNAAGLGKDDVSEVVREESVS